MGDFNDFLIRKICQELPQFIKNFKTNDFLLQDYIRANLTYLHSCVEFKRYYPIFSQNIESLVLELGFQLMMLDAQDEDLIEENPISYV